VRSSPTCDATGGQPCFVPEVMAARLPSHALHARSSSCGPACRKVPSGLAAIRTRRRQPGSGFRVHDPPSPRRVVRTFPYGSRPRHLPRICSRLSHRRAPSPSLPETRALPPRPGNPVRPYGGPHRVGRWHPVSRHLGFLHTSVRSSRHALVSADGVRSRRACLQVPPAPQFSFRDLRHRILGLAQQSACAQVAPRSRWCSHGGARSACGSRGASQRFTWQQHSRSCRALRSWSSRRRSHRGSARLDLRAHFKENPVFSYAVNRPPSVVTAPAHDQAAGGAGWGGS